MGSISDYLEDRFLNHVLKTEAFTPSGTLYVGLSEEYPQETAAGIVEPSDTAYLRHPITWSGSTGRSVTQSGGIAYPRATEDWGDGFFGELYYWFICDEPTNSGFNMYAHGSLTSALTVVSGNTAYIRDREIVVSVNTGDMSTYLSDAFLDWAFRGQALAQPTNIYTCLSSGTINDATTGSGIEELTMTNYAREIADVWTTVTGGASQNQAIIDFGTLSGTAETAESIALCDAAADGNILFYDNSISGTITDGLGADVLAGDFDILIS